MNPSAAHPLTRRRRLGPDDRKSVQQRRVRFRLGITLGWVLAASAGQAEEWLAEADVVVVVDTSTSMREVGMDPERTSLLVTKLLADISPGSLAAVRLLDLAADAALLPSKPTGEQMPCSEDPTQICKRVEPATDWQAEAREKQHGALVRPARGDRGFKERLDLHLAQTSHNSPFDLALRAAEGVLAEQRKKRSADTDRAQTVLWLSDGRVDHEAPVALAVADLVRNGVRVEAIVFGRGDTRLPKGLSLTTHQVSTPAELMKAFAGAFRRIVGAPHEIDALLAASPSFELLPGAEEVWVVVYGDDTLEGAELAGPGAVLPADDGADRWPGAGAYRVAHLVRPTPGRYTVRSRGGGPSTAYAVVQRSALVPVFLGPETATAGEPVVLRAEIRSGTASAPIRSAETLSQARLTLTTADGEVVLEDQGQGGDAVAGDGIFSARLTFTSLGDQKVELRLVTPLIDRSTPATVEVNRRLSFWERWGWLILLFLALLVVAFLIAGYVVPERFQPSLALVFAPDRADLDEQTPQPVRQWRGVGVGFYRNARAFLHADFRLSGTSAGALAALIAVARGTRVLPGRGNSLFREAVDGSFEPVPAEGRIAHQGDLYRMGERGPFFRLTSSRGRR